MKFLNPTARLILNPTALHNEKRPPTQSDIGKIFFESIPKALTLSIFVDTATNCFAISGSDAYCKNHFLIVVALDMVSWVVNVLETIIKSVVSGLSFFKTSFT